MKQLIGGRFSLDRNASQDDISEFFAEARQQRAAARAQGAPALSAGQQHDGADPPPSKSPQVSGDKKS